MKVTLVPTHTFVDGDATMVTAGVTGALTIIVTLVEFAVALVAHAILDVNTTAT